MNQVQGYIFIPKFKGNPRRIAFGKGYQNKPELFEEQLNPYTTKEEAIEGTKKYPRTFEEIEKFRIYNLNLRYAKTYEEFQEFQKESNLVVMLMLEENDRSLWAKRCLIGPITNGKPSLGYIPGAKLQDNGYRLFTSKGKRTAFERVLYCHSELRRQGQLPCTIGQLKMKKVCQIPA